MGRSMERESIITLIVVNMMVLNIIYIELFFVFIFNKFYLYYYKGDYENGKKHGMGIFYYASGNKYEGNYY